MSSAPRTARGRRTREKILASALKEFGKVGYHDASIVRITEGAGVAKALAKKVRLLILDEPTASLNENDSQALLDLLLEFKAQGMTMIMISHKLNEIARVADSVTIIRDGKTVETLVMSEHTGVQDRIIRGMVGRDLEHRYPERPVTDVGEEVFRIENWTVHHPTQAGRVVVDNANLSVRAGEVVGEHGFVEF